MTICKKILLLFFCFLILAFLPLNAQELREEIKQDIPISSKGSYNIQKYSGFNFFVTSLTKTIVKTLLKLKTHAKNINCKLEIFSGIDLLKKKVKFFSLSANDLKIKNIPLEYIEINVTDPIYLKKTLKKRYRVVYPVNLDTKTIIDPSTVIELVDSMSKSDKQGKEIELPLPPFGSTKVLLQDLMVLVSENGFIESTINAVSASNPNSEAFVAMFSGNIVIEDKKLLINDLKCEAEDIFTKDSDIGMAFCEAIGELINPVVNFHKYEKRGLTIDTVNLSFPENKLFLKMNLMLMPEGRNANNQK